MLNHKLSDSIFPTPYLFPSTSVWKHRAPGSFGWWCALRSVPCLCHCHPSWVSRWNCGLPEHSSWQLACASLSSRACTGSQGTSEGSGPPRSHPSSLLLDFSIFTKQLWCAVGSHTHFLPLVSDPHTLLCVSEYPVGKGFLNSVLYCGPLSQCIFYYWLFFEGHFVLGKILNFVLVKLIFFFQLWLS